MFGMFSKKIRGAGAEERPVSALVKRTRRRCAPEVARLEDRALMATTMGTQYTPFVTALYNSVLKTTPTQANIAFWDTQLARGESPSRVVSIFENAGVKAGTYVRTSANSNSNGANVNFPGGSVNLNSHAVFWSFLGAGAGVSRNGANVHIPFASVTANRHALFGGVLGVGAGINRSGHGIIKLPGGRSFRI
jgi:hypothetical protein